MQEIFIRCDLSIDEAHGLIQESAAEIGEPCYGWFRDYKVCSNETIEDVYKKIYGKSKEEKVAEWAKFREEYDLKEQEHKAAIPALTEEYRAKARGVIPEESLELWDKIVPIRLWDLYHGMELDCWLELISVLNDESKTKEERFAECKRLHIAQGHSGMSWNLVLSGLCQLHKLGKDCAEYINKD